MAKDFLAFKGRFENGKGVLTPEILDALHLQLKAIEAAPSANDRNAKIKALDAKPSGKKKD